MAVRGDVSVVVPTTGRPELLRALASARQQTLPPAEIVVVDDSGTGAVAPPDAGPVPVVLLRTSGREGAAAARNAGMAAASGAFVAFLDDDDEWLPGHLEAAVGHLRTHPDVDVYACAALVRSPARERVEPTVLYGGRQGLLRFQFGRTVWARRRRRVLTPTLVFRREVARTPMDAGLSVREDLWWLLQAERAGHRLQQTGTVGVVVHADPSREAARVDLPGHLAWADRLDSLRPGTGASYLVGVVARQLAREGDAVELERVAAAVRGRGPVPPDLRLVLAAATALASVLARLRARRGHHA